MKIDEDIVLEKKKIRVKIKNLLDSLSAETRKLKSGIINDSLLKSNEYITARSVFIYHPFRKEIDTREIIKDALAKSKKVILPKVYGSELKIFFIKDVHKDLKPGSFNILEPDISSCREASLNSIDLVIVPGLGFDLNFNRLGYGGGFYDKILEKLARKVKKIALAFDLQILDNIPSCSHDQKVDIIITESNIYRDLTIDN
ncbi:MAG: 5-formyltetrahydrofolate cyclo-ligase [Actinobacteria bacterium]|nr:5-formyltetrahydrofolate cyclo-ligase [Actinomycetota bacterium]